MLERTLILIFVLFVGVALWQLWRYYQTVHLTQVAQAGVPAALADRLASGPTILYFTGAHCAQCRLQQSPILAQLVEMQKIHLHMVDAVQEDALAKFYGVMTLPTTVVLDSRHRPKAINHGLASLQQLRQQVAALL